MKKTRPIDLYDAKTGRWLAFYPSELEAALLTGFTPATISRAIRGVLRTVGNKKYIFRSTAVEYKPKPKSNMANHKGKPVNLYEKNGTFVRRFDKCKDAAEYIGVTPSPIHLNLKGNTKLIKNMYYVKYAND